MEDRKLQGSLYVVFPLFTLEEKIATGSLQESLYLCAKTTE